MDFTLAPITTLVDVPHLLVPRIVMTFANLYLMAAWIFPHALSFMLALVFTHEYKELGRNFETRLAESDDDRVSDSDIEAFRQQHQKISMNVDHADDILCTEVPGQMGKQTLDPLLSGTRQYMVLAFSHEHRY